MSSRSRRPRLTPIVSYDEARLTFCVFHAPRLIPEAKERLLAGFEQESFRVAAEAIFMGEHTAPPDIEVLIQQARTRAADKDLPQPRSTEPWDGTCRMTDWFTAPAPVSVGYTPPETSPPLILVGKVKGHPCFADGDDAETTTVLFERSEGRRITVAEGLVVHVEEPKAGWVQWMKDNYIPFDPDRPLRLVGPEELAARRSERAGVSA